MLEYYFLPCMCKECVLHICVMPLEFQQENREKFIVFVCTIEIVKHVSPQWYTNYQYYQLT